MFIQVALQVKEYIPNTLLFRLCTFLTSLRKAYLNKPAVIQIIVAHLLKLLKYLKSAVYVRNNNENNCISKNYLNVRGL